MYGPNNDVVGYKKFTMGDLRSHLKGVNTYGHYLVSPEGKCRLFAFDIDLNKTGVWKDMDDVEHNCEPREIWRDVTHPGREQLLIELRCMAEGLAIRTKRMYDIPVAVAYSGSKGLHVYAWTGSIDAGEARKAADEVFKSFGCFEQSRGENFWIHSAAAYPNISIERFPKQSSVGDGGFGNLMRLPLGVNKKSGNKGFFLDMSQPYNTLAPATAHEVLANGSDLGAIE